MGYCYGIFSCQYTFGCKESVVGRTDMDGQAMEKSPTSAYSGGCVVECCYIVGLDVGRDVGIQVVCSSGSAAPCWDEDFVNIRTVLLNWIHFLHQFNTVV